MSPMLRQVIELLAHDGHHSDAIVRALPAGVVTVAEVQAIRRRIIDHSHLGEIDRLRFLAKRGLIP